MKFYWTLVFALLAAPNAWAADAPQLNKALNERIVFIRHGFGVELETTIFKPDGNGPFPLAIINHGREFGDSRFQPRARYIVATRELVRRGYVVALPMRAGFSKSSGQYISSGCNILANARQQAEYVRSALEYMAQQPYVDKGRVVILGQSHGGLTAIALSTEQYEGVRGVINFAGGLRLRDCNGWENNLVSAFGDLGRSARYPSLWFYGDNDSYFEIALAKRMYAAFTGAGGKAQLVAYGEFKTDSHRTFSDRDGLKLWWPETERFLQALGLPTAMLPRTAYDDPDLAAVADMSKVPYIQKNCQSTYGLFLDADYPRAFAVSADAHCGYAYGGDDPKKRALDFCQRRAKEPCRLYAVDNAVVWN